MGAFVDCKCGRPAVIRLRTSGQSLCGDHFVRSFERRAKSALADQGRLPEGTVAVALSGGKDSVALLHFLHGITHKNPRIKLVAVTINEGIEGYRETSLDICREVTEKLGVEWKLVATQDLAGYTIDQFAAGEKGPDAHGQARPACGPCGVFRRVGINRLAAEAGASVVATGHNLDDMAQTVLMNVLEGDVERLGRLAPHAEAQPGLIRRVIPFREVSEKEVLLYCLLNGLPIHDEAECPYAERARRFAMRDTLLELEDRSPGTRHGLLRFQDKVKDLLAHRPAEDLPPMVACATCGEPTSGTTCKACQWR